MIDLYALEDYCNTLLSAGSFDDYAPNGVQVDAGQREIRRIVSGVTASYQLIHCAAEAKADLLLVHHGWFWRGEPSPLVGIKGRRVRALMEHQISLLAYHLPLDAHPQLGNNAQLGERLGFTDAAPLVEGGLLWGGRLEQSATPEVFANHLARVLQREPLHLPGGPERFTKVAWCSGSAEREIESAARHGYHVFVSGEVSEPSMHLARELGIHYFSAGHHATERFGVQALGDHLARQYGIEHQFIDLPNPV